MHAQNVSLSLLIYSKWCSAVRVAVSRRSLSGFGNRTLIGLTRRNASHRNHIDEITESRFVVIGSVGSEVEIDIRGSGSRSRPFDSPRQFAGRSPFWGLCAGPGVLYEPERGIV